jgi:transcriptional regulator with XRE-family HTH domain
MKDRLLEFLRNENKTSAQLAEEIGVQASGISHILSGRNNPSLDFILKMLEKYQFLSTDWLLFGKGSMYTEQKMQNLFDVNFSETRENRDTTIKKDENRKESDIQNATKNIIEKNLSQTDDGQDSEVVKIVWFYDNNSFEEFIPRK